MSGGGGGGAGGGGAGGALSSLVGTQGLSFLNKMKDTIGLESGEALCAAARVTAELLGNRTNPDQPTGPVDTYLYFDPKSSTGKGRNAPRRKGPEPPPPLHHAPYATRQLMAI